MKRLLFLIAFFTVLFSCKQPPKPQHTQIVVNIDDSTRISENKVYVKYKIPLPIDLFNYFLTDGYFRYDFLVPSDIVDKCLNEKHKALVLGLANADLAFCTVTGQSQLSRKYFQISKDMAYDLGIDVGYTNEIYDRFLENMDKPDSLERLANEAYWRTCNYLEENHKYNILPFVVAAGWYESMYILIKAEGKEIYSDDVVSLVLKQEEGFQHVQKFLYDAQLETSANYYYQDIKKIIQNIQKILDIYRQYYSDVSHRKQLYNELINNIFETRNNYLKGIL